MAGRCAIVAERPASFPPGRGDELAIRHLPLHVDIGNESDTAGVDLTAEEFYAKIAAPDVKPGTSQPSMGECRDIYDRIVREGIRKMIVITIASELSGTYSVASTTGQQLSDARIEVVDSRSVAGAISLIATPRPPARRDGHSFDQATPLARRLAGEEHILPPADGLQDLQRSG